MDTATAPPAPGPTLVDALSLLAEVTDELVVGSARDTHEAVTRRIHGVLRLGLGSTATPVEVAHRGIAGAVFGGLGLALRGASSGLDRLAAAGIGGPRLEDGARGRFVTSAVNGLIGDQLLRERPQLALPMTVRAGGRDVLPEPDALAASYPDATGRVVVFLHGLCENESYWSLHRERTGTTYGEALTGLGWTPVYLRANTGLPIRENGVALAALLRDLVASWPVDVERIALVGHSMGGLVMRAGLNVLALASADQLTATWTDRVTDVVTLGSPHRGAPIAWGIGHGSRLLALLPETSAFGRVLDKRSEGVRDLVDGYVDELPPLKEARYRLVAATVTSSARHPVGSYVGDYLVRPHSAVGRDKRGAELFPDAETLHVGRTDHFGILNHPEVLAALKRWLA